MVWLRSRVFGLLVSSALLTAGLASSGCKGKSSGDGLDGRELFEGSCARCHGQSGQGGPPVYTGGPSPRNFRDHAFQTRISDAQLRTTIVSGKGASMPGFGGRFSDAELSVLVAYLRTLDPEHVAPAASSSSAAPVVPSASAAPGSSAASR